MQVEIPEDERDDVEFDLNEFGFLSEDEDEVDDDDLIATLQDEGLLGSSRSADLLQNSDDVATLKLLLHGLTLSQKGHALLSKGCEQIKAAIVKCPSLHKIGGLVEMIKSTDPNLVAKATPKNKIPQVFETSKPDLYKPLKYRAGKGESVSTFRYRCRICSLHFGSYQGCDSHIRKEHTKLKYGPCPRCEFTTTNLDSWRKHQSACHK